MMVLGLRAVHTARSHCAYTRGYARVLVVIELIESNDDVHTDDIPHRGPCERPFSSASKRWRPHALASLKPISTTLSS